MLTTMTKSLLILLYIILPYSENYLFSEEAFKNADFILSLQLIILQND